MKLDKAIEILSYRVNTGRPPEEQDYIDALKLGIKALKRVKLQHNPAGVTTPTLLPGETEGVENEPR